MSHYQQLIDFLHGCDDLLLTAHHDPDADCLGSMLGLYHMFAGKQRGWVMVLEDEIPQNLHFLPEVELIVHPQQILRRPAAVLLVDCGEVSRVSRGWLDTYIGLPFYCIDHHISNDFKGELAVVEPDASSTGEIVAALCETAGQPLSTEAATCLYSAIVSDTGCFRYENTTPRALEIAARLLRLGVDMEQVRIKLFENRSPSGIAILQTALNNLQFIAEGRLCYTFVRHKEALAVQAKVADLNNISNFTLLQNGVIIGVFFEEYEDHVKISLRSRRGLRVDKLAQSLGGGGHMRAAGCSLKGDLDSILPQVLSKARKLLENEV